MRVYRGKPGEYTSSGRRKLGTGGVYLDGGWTAKYGGYGVAKWAAFAPTVMGVRKKLGRFGTRYDAEKVLKRYFEREGKEALKRYLEKEK